MLLSLQLVDLTYIFIFKVFVMCFIFVCFLFEGSPLSIFSRKVCVFIVTMLGSMYYLKGRALVSVLYDYSQHGDPAIRSLLLHILSQVSGCGQCRIKVLDQRLEWVWLYIS